MARSYSSEQQDGLIKHYNKKGELIKAFTICETTKEIKIIYHKKSKFQKAIDRLKKKFKIFGKNK